MPRKPSATTTAATPQKATAAPATTPTNNYNERRWMSPNRRAKGYAQERKNKVHMFGDKNGTPLDDYNKGLRSGYLLCQSDHAGQFRYKQAMDKFNDKDYARQFSREKGTKLKDK